tara:strand:- start:274 stop:489 length:216 start_codon:yes stop_codon:yes gene_type:complete
MNNKIDYTIEILYHFTCSQCQHWWSYTMTPTNNKMSLNIDDRIINCMHCGNKGETLIKKGFSELLDKKKNQ